MIGAAWPASLSRSAALAFAIGLASFAALAVGLAFAPIPVVQGWLAAVLFWRAIPVGSLVPLLIHRLDGGSWGGALAPVLLPAASLMSLVALAFLPVVLGLAAIYPWTTQAALLPPGVGR